MEFQWILPTWISEGLNINKDSFIVLGTSTEFSSSFHLFPNFNQREKKMLHQEREKENRYRFNRAWIRAVPWYLFLNRIFFVFLETPILHGNKKNQRHNYFLDNRTFLFLQIFLQFCIFTLRITIHQHVSEREERR